VRLLEPDPILRPETLVRARFLAPPGDGGASSAELFRVPREALREGAVFVLHPEGARRIAVEKVAEADGDALVRGPLAAGQSVIVEEVREGERVEAER
jgi:hypothetical protein